MGCNQGRCHGKGAGQNGFRLSLRGFAPEQDYKWITREFDGRRLDPANAGREPDSPQADRADAARGRPRLRPGSREYDLLLAWLKGGLPRPNASRAERSRSSK